jgi:hypothetical protein
LLISRYSSDPAFAHRLRRFFERLVTIRFSHASTGWSDSIDTDNLGFIGWELSLYAVATFLWEEAFSSIGRLVAPLHVSSSRIGGALRAFDVLQPWLRLFELTRTEKGIQVYDLAADLVRKRSSGSPIPFEALMEADLLLWYRLAVPEPSTEFSYEGTWDPRTLIYLGHTRRLPFLERARTAEFFERAAPALGVRDRAEFISRFRQIPDGMFYHVGHTLLGREHYARQLDIDSP